MFSHTVGTSPQKYASNAVTVALVQQHRDVPGVFMGEILVRYWVDNDFAAVSFFVPPFQFSTIDATKRDRWSASARVGHRTFDDIHTRDRYWHRFRGSQK
jgi:hypothetical protein